VIDAVLDYDPASGRTSNESIDLLTEFILSSQLRVQYIIDTHAHADHLSGSHALKKRYPEARMMIGARIRDVQSTFVQLFALTDVQTDGSQWDYLCEDGDSYMLGSISCQVLFTPGHTPACATHVIGDALFVGDTIFMPDMGSARCDFPNGSADQLWDSIQRILAFPPAYRVFVGHDYMPNGRELRFESSVAEQLHCNIHTGRSVHATKESFVQWRAQRDATLALPRLIVPALQVNIRAGQLPDYIHVPVNKL
jgi:glyoxylase-like metal-dependent hydrolase (beta-lactamase superfamily II)